MSTCRRVAAQFLEILHDTKAALHVVLLESLTPNNPHLIPA